ncbi:TPA: restriction endonuclease subunit S [Streptococcus suis]
MVDERKIPEGYRVTEVGVIPENWDIKKVGDIAFVSSGGTPNTKIIEYWNGKIRWMNSGELNLKRVYEVDGRITEQGLNNSSTKIIPKNSILIGLAGQGKTRGTAAINYVDLCINQSIAAIYPSNFYDSEFLYQNINSRYNELRSMSTGDGGRGGLNLKIIRELQIHLPTLSEQKAIAEALSDTDNLIQSLEKLINKKKKIKQGAMQQLLTGKKRLPGFSGEWEEVNLGDICSRITTGKLDANAMKTDGIYRFYTCAKEYYWIDKYSFDDEALLISGNGANVGYIHYYKGKFNAYQRTYVLTGFFESIIYVKYYLEKYLADRISAEVNAGNTPYIKMDTLTDMIIKLPPQKDEQKAIAQVLSDMDAEIEGLEEKLEKYKTIKQGMMQELLTGRIRLI